MEMGRGAGGGLGCVVWVQASVVTGCKLAVRVAGLNEARVSTSNKNL